MRLIGVVLAFSLAVVLTPPAGNAERVDQRQSKDFPGGVVFVERIDAMTDERICAVHTAMRGVQAVVARSAIAFFVPEQLGPVVPNPAPSLRIGEGKPIQLAATDRPYLIAVPKDRVRETIEALYAHRRVIVRWYDRRGDEHTMSVETGDFGAAYDYAVASCGWSRLAVKRGVFVAPPAPAIPAPADFGEPIQLDSTDPVYGEYLDRVRRSIKGKWGYPCVKDLATGHCDYKSAEILIEFGILKDGRVPYVVVTQPSEWPILDDYAANAIRLSSPFPPIPSELMARTTQGSAGVRIVGRFIYKLEGSSLTNVLR